MQNLNPGNGFFFFFTVRKTMGNQQPCHTIWNQIANHTFNHYENDTKV